ncbi:MAG: DNA-processing protein DprA [Oscillospiraceae bacterium]|nr:DNA-processing protein DprA [Oscillospiraceae bacterium]
MPNTAKWVWLSEAFYKGSSRAKELVMRFRKIEALFQAGEAEIKRALPTVTQNELSALLSKDLYAAEEIIKKCRQKEIRIITPESKEYPKRLKNIANPPMVLYARGLPLSLDEEAAVALIGTRKATKIGERAAKKLGREVAAAGGTVVSGLARGIDSFSAEGALSAGGKVVAVFGCGVDVPYPRENKKLIEKVCATGTLISEFPPGTQPEKINFPIRNRIMSGISLGTAVIEAPEKSGALITARYAVEQDRDVFAVPSDIFNENGAGTNALIREGAIPVMSGFDIVSEYESLFPDRLKTGDELLPEENVQKEERDFEFPAGFLDKFSPDERQILAAISASELYADEIFSKSGMRAEKALSLITLLEIRGVIKKLPGNKFKIKDV